MNQRGARRHRLDSVEHGGKLLEFHLDQPGGGPRRLARGRGDGGDDVPRVAGHPRQDVLVADLTPVKLQILHVPGHQRHAVGRHRRNVDGDHARMWVWAAHERRVEHAGTLGVDRVTLQPVTRASMPSPLTRRPRRR